MHMANIVERFNQLSWHDSKLKGISITRNHERPVEEVTLDLELYCDRQVGGYKRRRAVIVLTDCRYIRLAMDVENKRLCSDDISQASCEKDSPLKQQIEDKIVQEPLQPRPEEKQPLAKYYLFRIQLIPPGGEIAVVAKDFRLTVLE